MSLAFLLVIIPNKFETPYNCTVKIAFLSGTDGEYNILNLKSGIKSRVDDILHCIHKEIGNKATLFEIANTLINYLPEVTYVEFTMNGEDGVTIYRNTVDYK